jgi:cell wall-associated NlpC family hydrolase
MVRSKNRMFIGGILLGASILAFPFANNSVKAANGYTIEETNIKNQVSILNPSYISSGVDKTILANEKAVIVETVGNKVTISAMARGGVTGDYTYEFIDNYNGKREILQKDSYLNEFTITAKRIGTHHITVRAKDMDGNIGSYSWKVNVVSDKADLGGKLTSNKKSNIRQNQNFTLTVNATGGHGDYTYEFSVLKNGKEKIIKPFSTTSTLNVKATETGDLTYYVTILDKEDQVVKIPLKVKVTNKGMDIVEKALEYVGNPYVYGGMDLYNGIDCSAFVLRIHEKFGISLPRTTYEQIYSGVSVSRENILPGDIILYDGHVGIYMGDNKMVHASNSRPYPAGGIKVTEGIDYRPILDIRRCW